MKIFKTIFVVACLTTLLWAANTVLTGVALKNSTVDSTTLGATTPSSGAFTTLTSNAGATVSGGFIVNSGIQSGTGFKHFRVTGGSCTTSGTQGSTCQTPSISLPGTAYADTNYTITCMEDGFIAVNTGTPTVIGTGTKTTSSFTLVVAQVGAVAAAYGAIDCVSAHD